jgi:4-carboxymuconolactone decarboxylase
MPNVDADRMPQIPEDQWSTEQTQAAAEFARMRGQKVFGPFAVMLRSPRVMLRAAAMGDYMRYHTSLPGALNELIILITARHWSQQFEWYVHQPMALKAGLSPQIVEAVSKGRRPGAMSGDEAIVYDFATELLRLQNVSDVTYSKAVERFGEHGVIDMIGVAGYYSFLSMMMNTARTAVPADSDVPPLP